MEFLWQGIEMQLMSKDLKLKGYFDIILIKIIIHLCIMQKSHKKSNKNSTKPYICTRLPDTPTTNMLELVGNSEDNITTNLQQSFPDSQSHTKMFPTCSSPPPKKKPHQIVPEIINFVLCAMCRI